MKTNLSRLARVSAALPLLALLSPSPVAAQLQAGSCSKEVCPPRAKCEAVRVDEVTSTELPVFDRTQRMATANSVDHGQLKKQAGFDTVADNGGLVCLETEDNEHFWTLSTNILLDSACVPASSRAVAAANRNVGGAFNAGGGVCPE